MHDWIMVVGLTELNFREEHALEPGPEEPDHGLVFPTVAKVL